MSNVATAEAVSAPAPVAAEVAQAAPAPAPAAPESTASAPAPAEPAKSALAAAVSDGDPDDASKPWAAPEKFRVLKEDGSLDLEATARKIDGAYRNAQGRIGTGDVRPKSAEDYAFTPPDQLKDAFRSDDPDLASMRTEAYKLGVTQQQLDFFMGRYYAKAQDLVNGSVQLDQAQATSELQKVWTTPQSFSQNAGNAYKAIQQIGGDLADQMMQRYGNDPVMLQFAARVGAQLGEDTTVSGNASSSTSSIQTLLSSPAYSDAKHPDHAKVTAQVNAYYSSQPGANNPA